MPHTQKLQFNPVFAQMPTTIFTRMSALATKHSAINLGQGFPDEDGPASIRESAANRRSRLRRVVSAALGMESRLASPGDPFG